LKGGDELKGQLTTLLVLSLPILLGMAGNFADYLENKVLDHVLGGGDYTRPATVYLALFTARGTDPQSDAGTNFSEVSTGVWTNYARKSITNNNTNFPAASAGAKASGADITFAAATITSGTVTVVAVGLYDASTSGNLIAWADLAASKGVQNGDVFNIPSGSLAFTLD
jgi:hypothetical protein